MKKIITENKSNLHPRNQFRDKYDFTKLINSYETLSKFVFTNEYGTQTIDFALPEAVKALNTAILISNSGSNLICFSNFEFFFFSLFL